MRPLTLRIKGFTSFRDEQTIDFTELDLFALWGPTGSGKSSVLDAMTYALYGEVERVSGDRVSQISHLISQGQPRMTVELDFSCDGRSHRIARSTAADGTSTARLEKQNEAGEWISFGPGADKLREVKKLVVGLVGLDYDTFTRSVLLPQGKFAELLVGDAVKRREILTELLGLELFDRMAKRANEVRKEEGMRADTKQTVVDQSFAGIDSDALEAAQSRLEKSESRVGDAERLEEQLAGVVEQYNTIKSTGAALVTCRKEIQSFTSDFQGYAAALERLEREAAAFTPDLEAATKNKAEARKVAAQSQTERASFEKRWGSLDRLASLAVHAQNLNALCAELERSERFLVEARAAAKQSQLRIARAQKEVDGTGEVAAKAGAEVERSTAAHDEAHRHDRVGSLVHDLGTGDPCPVCDRPLETIPSFDSSELTSSAEDLKAAKNAAERANEAHGEAKIALAEAMRDNASAGDQTVRCTEAADEARTKHGKMLMELEEALAGKLPDDPVAELELRNTDLRQLIERERHTESAHREALEGLSALHERHRRLEAEISSLRTRMESAGLEAALDRVAQASAEIDRPDFSSIRSLPTTATALADEAERTTKALLSLESDLDECLRSRRAEVDSLVTTMTRAVPNELGVQGDDPGSILTELRRVHRVVAAEAALATERKAELERKLEERRLLEDEIAGHREQQAAYAALQKELKADRIVQFLQAEALVVLASAATEHLRDLSSSRYRLIYEGDRFFVVDAWNGDEKRNVRTLSGGETFLTSLSLALALSEQIQLLSVTEKSRLDSLFLDEGFGQLDTDHLDVVVDAIEQLRASDRLVGIITHVAEVAERMPVRLEVSKSPRGSTIRRSVTEVTLTPPA
ncbi:exonuclease SbcCD subunit SbcC [soil metagenome]